MCRSLKIILIFKYNFNNYIHFEEKIHTSYTLPSPLSFFLSLSLCSMLLYIDHLIVVFCKTFLMYLWSCQLITDISFFLAILMLNLGSLTFDKEQILSFVSSCNFYLVPYSSTHHSRTASTLLDLCMIDADKLICHEQRDIGFFVRSWS